MSGEAALPDIRKDILDTLSRVEGKLDNFIITHANQHSAEQQNFSSHLLNSAVMGERGKAIWDDVTTLQREVESLNTWRAEIRGMTNLAKVALGTSVIAAIVSILSLWEMITM